MEHLFHVVRGTGRRPGKASIQEILDEANRTGTSVVYISETRREASEAIKPHPHQHVIFLDAAKLTGLTGRETILGVRLEKATFEVDRTLDLSSFPGLVLRDCEISIRVESKSRTGRVTSVSALSLAEGSSLERCTLAVRTASPALRVIKTPLGGRPTALSDCSLSLSCAGTRHLNLLGDGHAANLTVALFCEPGSQTFSHFCQGSPVCRCEEEHQRRLAAPLRFSLLACKKSGTLRGATVLIGGGKGVVEVAKPGGLVDGLVISGPESWSLSSPPKEVGSLSTNLSPAGALPPDSTVPT